MPLLERDIFRLVEVLGDYELLVIDAITKDQAGSYQIVVTDTRFNARYVIASHFDYWDFLGYFVDHKAWPGGGLGLSDVTRSPSTTKN